MLKNRVDRVRSGTAVLIMASVVTLAHAEEPTKTAPVPASEMSLRREVFHNDRVAAFLLEIPPQQATQMHRHDKDLVNVVVGSARTTNTIEGQAPVTESRPVGEVRFKRAGFTHSTRNDDMQTFRTVVLEFAESQGESISEQLPLKRYCNDGSVRACVEEKHLFCTATLCVSDVTMGPGATRSGFAVEVDQLLVAVTDYQLSDEFDGSTTSSRERTSGQVEWIPKGSSVNRMSNAAGSVARFVVIRFGTQH